MHCISLSLLAVLQSQALPVIDDIAHQSQIDDSINLIQRQASLRSLVSEATQSNSSFVDAAPGHTSDRNCVAATECQLEFATVVKSEMEKGGELRYGNVCILFDGTKVDMAVTTASSYSSARQHLNGLWGVYGTINVNAHEEWDFTFSFYKAGTTTPVTIKSFYFSLFDIDGWWTQKGGMRQREQITISGYEYF